MNSHPDVVVVGAGAAGISAAHKLIQLGISVAVVEAANRIGGRCWTDMETFGIPYDVGAHWLHYDSDNFYLEYGKQNGFAIYPDPKKFHLFRKDQEQPEGFSSIAKVREDYETAIEKAASQGHDISLEEAAQSIDDPNKKTIEFIIGPWVLAKEVAELSTLDVSTLVDSTDWFCKEGFGALVAHYGANLPVSLNTEVNAIDWSGSGVKVETTRGSIQARAAIVTVSTGVLAADKIQFLPKLPQRKVESFHSISMGCYEHVVLQLKDGDFFGEPDSYVIRMADEQSNGFGALLNVCGTNLAFCDIGGDTGRELTQHGTDVSIDYALSQLAHIFGNNAKQQYINGTSSTWLTNPYTRGSYASAKPGAFQFREVLRETVGKKVFFAGEACHPTMWASVAGAHISGHDVAAEVGKLMK